MTTTTTATTTAPATTTAAEVTLADVPPPAPARPRVLMVGTAFATAGVLMVLAGLLGTYLFQRAAAVSAGDTWLPEGVIVPLQQPTVMLFTLIAASVTVQWAVYSVAHNDKLNSYLALGLTFIFGFAFINMASYLYTLMGLDIAASNQAVLIYTITGAQLAMVIAGMLFVAVSSFRALAGQETSSAHDGVSSAALFWHATVALYFVIWMVVYVTK